jgi:hypothetical protein
VARLCSGRFFDVPCERGERVLPERLIAGQKLAGGLERPTDQIPVMVPARSFATKQPGSLQDPNVLRDGGQGHGERLGELSDGRWPQ